MVSFVFTDIVNSTGLWEADRDAMSRALELHDQLLDRIFAEFEGEVFKRVGDAYCVAFGHPADAAHAAIAAQRAVAATEWPAGAAVAIRAAVHAGPVVERSKDYFGPTVNRVARLLGEAQGGQVLLSGTMHSLLADTPEPRPSARYLGRRRLRGIADPIELYELAEGPDSTARPPPHGDGRLRYVGNRVDAGRPFVGRGAEMEALCRQLDDPQVRVLTIVGMGGMGKTRIACRLAESLAPQFRDGAQIVDCGSLADRAGLIAALFASAECEPTAGTLEELADSLAERECLIVLDCFEHLAGDSAAVGELADRCPGIRFLVTSRLTLALHCEYVFELGGLREDKDSRSNEALELFAQVVAQVAPEAAPTGPARAMALEICELLEGVPLAITLAAARLRHLGYEEVLSQLRANRLRPLVDGRAPDGRHATLQRVIDDSLKLLEERYRDCLGMLGCFEGGFTLADAEAVCGAGIADCSEAVSMLRDHSLLQARAERGKTRYRILDSIREYLGSAGLTPAEVRLRHARHFAQAAESISSEFSQGRWERGNAALFRDIGNIRRALETAVAAEDAAVVRSLCATIPRSLLEAGLYAEFERFAEAGLDCAARLDNPDLRLALLGLQGELHRRRDEMDVCMRIWNERAEAARRAGRPRALVDALLDLADAHKSDGSPTEAQRLVNEAHREAVAHGLKGFEATALAFQSLHALETGEPGRAADLAHRALAIAIGEEDRPHIPYVYRSAAKVLRDCGDRSGAQDALHRMIRISNDLSLVQSTTNALHDLALLHEIDGRLDRAVELLVAASDTSKDCAVSVRKTVRTTMSRFRKQYRTPELEPIWLKAAATDPRRVVRRLLASLR